MAEVKRYPMLRHLRSEPSRQILQYRRGRLAKNGRGLAFWFHPLSTSVAEVPMDDRELPFIFHGRSRDFQDVVVQGVVSYRVSDAMKIADRVDFTIDLSTGRHLNEPLEKIASLLTELSQQFAMAYLVRASLREALEGGIEAVRDAVEAGLRGDSGLSGMGLDIVSVRVGSVKPEAEVERALQARVRESIQQESDEAVFQRRAMAVQKERAIQENELQNQIELAKREQTLIAQRGENERRRASDEGDAKRIAAASAAERSEIESAAKAASIRAVEWARVEAERERMAIYRDFPADRLLGLAAQELAGKLQKIEHLNLTPELIGPMLTSLIGAGTKRLEGP